MRYIYTLLFYIFGFQVAYISKYGAWSLDYSKQRSQGFAEFAIADFRSFVGSNPLTLVGIYWIVGMACGSGLWKRDYSNFGNSVILTIPEFLMKDLFWPILLTTLIAASRVPEETPQYVMVDFTHENMYGTVHGMRRVKVASLAEKSIHTLLAWARELCWGVVVVGSCLIGFDIWLHL